uniref:Large ribosomal subunit protein bL34m n=3 Tax=Euarchontoglires TaxID=314146 RepID=A0A2K6UFF7_SAIBB
MPRRPGGYFLSSGGAGSGSGRALGEGSGSQSRNSWSSVLTVSGHSSITMWLPSSMSFRNAKSRICRRRGAQDRRGRERGAPESLAAGTAGPTADMALFAGSVLGPACRSTALLGGRWLQPRAWLGCPDAWGLPTPQQARGKARGNEYQPSNIKRKHKHGWIRRLSTPAGVQVILRRMLKGRKSLSH